MITFGTDGWRAKIDVDFTADKVMMLAKAVADHLHDRKLAKRGVLVGYDTRRKSKFFAEKVAEVLAGEGIRVLFPPRETPTPVVAYQVWRCKLGGAVVITASHNPPEWNGFKFIPHYAGPALPDVTSDIESRANRLLAEDVKAEGISFKKAEAEGLIEFFDPMPSYIDHVLDFVEADLFRNRGLKVVVDALYGATYGYLKEIFSRLGCEVIALHDTPHPEFHGILPDPTPKVLTELQQKVISTGASLGLATDGDGDRIGVCTPKGFFSANALFPVIYSHLLEFKGMRGDVVRTVATTHMVDVVAEEYGFSSIEVPVGFKYVGKVLREGKAVMGGEESGGFGFREHISEKDGLLSAAVIAELVVSSGKSLETLRSELEAKYGFYYSGRVDVPCGGFNAKQLVGEIVEHPPPELCGMKVISTSTLDGIKFILPKRSWLLLRPSGTEPVIRVYAESSSQELLKQILDCGVALIKKGMQALSSS